MKNQSIQEYNKSGRITIKTKCIAKRAILLLVALITLASLISCSSTKYEEDLLGTWGALMDDNDLMAVYSFNKDENGNYTAVVILSSKKLGEAADYVFDEFTASQDELVLKQGDEKTVFKYYIEEDCLYLDDQKYIKLPYDNLTGLKPN